MGDDVIEDSVSEWELPTSEASIAKAKEKGLFVVFPKPNQLQIDIDNNLGFGTYHKMIGVVKKNWGIENVVIRPSKSGGERKHITVTLGRDVTELERIGLQAVLGSDLRREQFGLIRCLIGDPHPTLFFETEVVWLGTTSGEILGGNR